MLLYYVCITMILYRFQAAIKKYGVPEEEIFQTADLFERRNIPQVTLCLYALARIVSIIHHLISFNLYLTILNYRPQLGCKNIIFKSEIQKLFWVGTYKFRI